MKNFLVVIFLLLGFIIANAQSNDGKASSFPVMTYKCPKGDALCDAPGKCPLCGTEMVSIKSSSNNVSTGSELASNSDNGIDALKKIRSALTPQEWIDFKAAIRSVPKSEFSKASRLPFYEKLANLDSATLKSFTTDFKAGNDTFRLNLVKEPNELVEAWKIIKGFSTPGEVFKSAKQVDFFKSVKDFTNVANVKYANDSWKLWKQENWSDLETLFKTKNFNGGWPPYNGGYNMVDDVTINAGDKFDRYGNALRGYTGVGVPNLCGNFTSPIIGGYIYKFPERALNQAENAYDFYFEIEVLQNLPFKGQTADIIPWFGQIGKGKQTMWKIPLDATSGYPKTWNKLAQEGLIKITIKNSPSGKYTNLIGTVIQ